MNPRFIFGNRVKDSIFLLGKNTQYENSVFIMFENCYDKTHYCYYYLIVLKLFQLCLITK